MPFSVEAERDYIASLSVRDLLHVAVCQPDMTIVGFQGLSPLPSHSSAFAHVGVIGTFVDLMHRRQGIARQLFTATFAAARGMGYEKIFTYVRADNPDALATYLNQGFRVVGTAKHHAKLNGQSIDEVMIEKLLEGEG